jgi:hypothetical protein
MAFQNLKGTLTELQCGVIYVLGFHADADGVFRLPASKIGLILGKSSQNHIASHPAGAGDARPGRVGPRRPLAEKPRHWKLTWRGGPSSAN